MTNEMQKKMALVGLMAVGGILGVTVVASMSARSQTTFQESREIGIRPTNKLQPAHERYRDYDVGLYIFPAERTNSRKG